MSPLKRPKFLTFNIAVFSLLNYWPKDENESPLWRHFKDSSLILSLMPCAIPIAVDFYEELNKGSEKNLVYVVEDMIALTCIIGMIYVAICFIKSRPLIRDLVDRIPNFSKYGQLGRINEIEETANLYSKVFLAYGILGNFVYLLMPQLQVAKCRDRITPEMIERGIPCGLVVRSIFPFKFDYSPVFQIIFFHQIYTCIMVTVMILVLTMSLCTFLMHIVHQLNYLKEQLKSLNDSPPHRIMSDLIYCVRFHTEIIEFAKDTNTAFSDMMLLHLTLTSVVISVLCFQVLMVDNLLDSVRFAFHLTGWLIILLLICYYADQLIQESVSVSDEIYNGPWFTSRPYVRKHLLMVIMRSQRPLTLSAASMGAMSLPTFLKVLSSAYSFFTLLLKLKV